MKSVIFGDNKVSTIVFGKQGKQNFCVGPYEYFYYHTKSNEELVINELRSFTLFIYKKATNASVLVDGICEPLEQGDQLQSEGHPVKLRVAGGEIILLVAGSNTSHKEQQGLFMARHADLYKVIKPWGHEIWINGQHPCYAFKEIFIKAGTKTSLQYHNFKQETNVLFHGTAKLHYKTNTNISNNEVTDFDISTTTLEPVSIIDVIPNTLHRIEAVTDILLYEASTPHLDDVVRVLDDSKRPDGRLEMEHNAR